MSPISPKQALSLRESYARINIWEGAVRSGKTYISLWRFLKHVAEGPAGEYCIIARTQGLFKKNVFPQLFNMIGEDLRYYSGKSEIKLWNKTIHIIGADDERAEAKIRGPTFEGAYVDEVSIIPESVFRMLKSRCAMGDSKIFGTTNPDSPYHWLKRDILDGNPDVKSWQFTLDDNPQLKDEEKEYLKRQYKGIWYQRFIEGKWVQAEGAIYDFFDESIHCIDFPPIGKSYVVGIDYGTTNPTAFVLLGHNPCVYPNLWVEDEYYYDSRVKQRQKTDSEYAEDLQKFIGNRHISFYYVDPSAASFKAEMRKVGFDNIIDAENEVNDGIRFVSNYLALGTLKICRKAKHLIKEMQSYVWDAKSVVKGEDRPLKENDHALDALRYAVFTHFFMKERKGRGPEDIERDWRESRGMAPDLPPFFR